METACSSHIIYQFLSVTGITGFENYIQGDSDLEQSAFYQSNIVKRLPFLWIVISFSFNFFPVVPSTTLTDDGTRLLYILKISGKILFNSDFFKD